MNNIDLNLYKIFLCVYECKNLSKAAEIFYISQPAITYNIKQLESQLGVKLFYRTSKGVEPTAESEELYYHISTALNTIKTGQQSIKKLKELETGSLRIGAPSHIGVFYLTEFIEKFHRMYPGVKIEIVSKSTSDMIYMLETRNLDLVIDSLPIFSKRYTLTIDNLTQLKNCFVCTKKFKENNIIENAKSLEKIPLIIPSATSSIRRKLEKFLENEKINLLPIIEVWTTEMMLEMVRRNMGVGYFIENIISNQKDYDDFEILDFDIELPKVDVSVVYIEDFLTMASTEFLKFLAMKE